MYPDTSFDLPVIAFIAIPAILVCLLVWAARTVFGTRQAALTLTAAVSWMAATWGVASTGIFRNWDRTPPPFGLLIVAILAISVAIAFSGFGKGLALGIPLWALVAVQGFRLPLEVAMHKMSERGVMPSIMSYSGRNFDIVTGTTAILVAALLFLGMGGRGLVWVWNVMGLGLLINVVVVAFLATPRFHYFGESQLNVWVTYPPFVWLPAVMVLAALAGHLIIFRALLRK